MRASSSWIKLQFVVRKHVMNTYQMHTLSLFLFYHIFSTSLSLPLPCSLIFLSFWLYPPSLAHFLSVFLMACHIDVTYSAVLYNIPLCMYMCMHTFFRVHIYVICIWESCVCLSFSYCCFLSHFSVSDHLHVLWTTVCELVHLFIYCVCAVHALSHLITGLCGDALICRL